MQLSQQQYLRYYQGAATAVQVVTECGHHLRLPAKRLRPFLTHTGVNGRFQLTVDAENHFLDLKKIS